jgi:glycerol-3-phosphate acyltransferase PlsY
MNKGVLLATAVMSLLLFYRHAENIGRLIKGTESRLGKKAGPAAAEPVVKPASHRHEAKQLKQNKHKHKQR